MRFNTAVSSMMVLLNKMEKGEVNKEDFIKFLQILAPFAPHITEELWSNLGNKDSVHLSIWPKWDKNKITEEKMKIVVQVNGKMRTEIMIEANAEEEEVKNQALLNEVVLKYASGKDIKKVFYVKNRLINIVL